MTENTVIETGVPAELKGIVQITYLGRENCKLTEKNGFLGMVAVIDKPLDTLPPEPEKPEKPKDGKEGKESSDAKKDTPDNQTNTAEEKNDPSAETKEKTDEKSDKKDADTDNDSVKDLPDGKIEKTVSRIFLSRAFPFDMPYEYISVLDKDKKEVGFIRSLDDFDAPERELLLRELEAKYYAPVIKKILSVKERYGFSYWKTECDFGEKNFTLQDTFRSIIKSSNEDGSERVFILDVDGNRYEIPNVEALDRHSYKKIELYL